MTAVKLSSWCDRGVPPTGGIVTRPFRSLCQFIASTLPCPVTNCGRRSAGAGRVRRVVPDGPRGRTCPAGGSAARGHTKTRVGLSPEKLPPQLHQNAFPAHLQNTRTGLTRQSGRLSPQCVIVFRSAIRPPGFLTRWPATGGHFRSGRTLTALLLWYCHRVPARGTEGLDDAVFRLRHLDAQDLIGGQDVAVLRKLRHPTIEGSADGQWYGLARRLSWPPAGEGAPVRLRAGVHGPAEVLAQVGGRGEAAFLRD
jgi:hypothetical protein